MSTIQWRTGDYPRRAKSLTDAAYADPTTHCEAQPCKHGNGTLAQHPPGSTWDAGHKDSGNPASPLRPEVSGCNRSNGATEGNMRRKGLIPTRKW